VEADVYVRRYALLVVHARKEEEKKLMYETTVKKFVYLDAVNGLDKLSKAGNV